MRASRFGEYSYFGGLDNLHAFIVGSTPYYAHRDALGNVVALTSQGTSVARTYFYDSWGTSTGGYDAGFGNADRARWKGALWMGPETDLYYLRNRWYEPRTGRFLSEDPIGLAGGINPYTFGGSDPVNRRDPLGLDFRLVAGVVEFDCVEFGTSIRCWRIGLEPITVVGGGGNGYGGNPFGEASGWLGRAGTFGGAEGGGWYSGADAAQGLGSQGPSCSHAVLAAIGTGILDAATLTGVFAALRFTRLARLHRLHSVSMASRGLWAGGGMLEFRAPSSPRRSWDRNTRE